MTIAGIICEYNPLHIGHIHQIAKTRELTGCDTVIAIMSGNFTQRGEPAVLNKFDRAKSALSNGVDLVLELPTPFSLSSAEGFALYAVKILTELHADYISFGSECGDIVKLSQLAQAEQSCNASQQNKNSEQNIQKDQTACIHTGNTSSAYDMNLEFRAELSKGEGYPKARAKQFHSELLDMPNNLLGFEYLRAIKQLNSPLKPLTIRRDSDYNQCTLPHTDSNNQYESNPLNAENTHVTPNMESFAHASDMAPCFPSALAIRQGIAEEKWANIRALLPENEWVTLQKTYRPKTETLESLVLHHFRNTPASQLAKIHNMSEGLHNRMQNVAMRVNNLETFYQTVKTKRYPMTRIRRATLCALLDIEQGMVKFAYSLLSPFMVLGIRANRLDILSTLSQLPNPLVCTREDFSRLSTEYQPLSQSILRADRLYASLTGTLPQEYLPTLLKV